MENRWGWIWWIRLYGDWAVMLVSSVWLTVVCARWEMVGRAGGVQITPHKRRGPIAAEFSSPGPAAIALPGLFGSKYTGSSSTSFHFHNKRNQHHPHSIGTKVDIFFFSPGLGWLSLLCLEGDFCPALFVPMINHLESFVTMTHDLAL